MKNISLYLFFIFLIFFIVIYCLKVNGYCDYSAKYNIEQVFCEPILKNTLFVLDDDKKTTWGLGKLYKYDEDFVIKFSKNKKISSFEIFNQEYKNHPLPTLNFYSSKNGEEWKLCKCSLTNEKEKNFFEFQQICEGNFIKLKYMDKNSAYWPMTEIKINEEK